jgi:hypothetical protein
VAAVAGSAWRVASLAAASGLHRVLAAAAIGVTGAVLEELALGLVSLGGSTWAGLVSALGGWVLVWRFVAPPAVGARAELARWWRARGPAERLVLGAGGGAFLAAAAYVLYRPAIGFDNTLYHYPEVLAWVRSGHPASIVQISYDYPVGNYPVTNEVLLTWGAALARSFAPMALWGVGAWVLCGLGLWTTARELRVPVLAAGAFVALGLGIPWTLEHLNEPGTDVPALAWTACMAALALGTRQRPALLAPALLAGGLALGTKTTPLVVVAAVLGGTIWSQRGRLRPPPVGVAVAGVAALAVSLPWYLRTWVQHGSPFWPVGTLPGSDARPPQFQLLRARFIETPVESLTKDFQHWRDVVAGGLLIPIGALLAALLGRRRDILLAAGLFAVGFLVWAATPTTGLPHGRGLFQPETQPAGAARYLMPALLVGALAIAMLAREGGLRGRLATVVLLGGAVWSWLTDVFTHGEPYLPRPGVLAAAAVAGAAGAGGAGPVWRRVDPAGRIGARLRAVPAVAVVAALAAAGWLGSALVGRHYIERHLQTLASTPATVRPAFQGYAGGPTLVGWFATQPAWLAGDEPVNFATRFQAVALAGNRLRHPIVLMPRRAPCWVLRRRAYGGWAVVSDPGFARSLAGVRGYDGFACFRHEIPAYIGRNYAVYRFDGKVAR